LSAVKRYTAAALAHFCDVDLKTIHNWANRGAIQHHRTEGRHLRFYRLDVADFLHAYGYVVPDELRAARPRVVLVHRDAPGLGALRRALARRFEVCLFMDPFDALVELAALAPDALALDVSLLGDAATRCVERLRASARTRQVRVVAIGEDPGAGAAFETAGASAYVMFDQIGELRDALERVTLAG
jgi:excisionase family DNA binding protein